MLTLLLKSRLNLALGNDVINENANDREHWIELAKPMHMAVHAPLHSEYFNNFLAFLCYCRPHNDVKDSNLGL